MLRIPADQTVALVSDLHLGDGGATDPFQAKDDLFCRFLDQVARPADALVIAGDGFDLAQAWTVERVRRGHPTLCDELIALARHRPVYYLQGNHDGTPEKLAAVFPFRFQPMLEIGDRILVAHGNHLDPRNLPGDQGAFWGARAHAALERIIRAPVRIPMRKHYLWSTRLGHWLFYRYGLYRLGKSRIYRALGRLTQAERCLDFLDYWGRGEWGDIHRLLGPAEALLAESLYDTVVLGHAHQAGRIRFPGGVYVNLGSWTHEDATYALYDGRAVRVAEWPSGRIIEDEAYRGILGPHRQKSFFDWWKAFYQGWFRYDVPAMHRAATGEENQ